MSDWDFGPPEPLKMGKDGMPTDPAVPTTPGGLTAPPPQSPADVLNDLEYPPDLMALPMAKLLQGLRKIKLDEAIWLTHTAAKGSPDYDELTAMMKKLTKSRQDYLLVLNKRVGLI